MSLGVQKKDKEGEYVQVKMEHMEVSVNDYFEFLLELS